ncbi:MAG: phosphoribosyl-AMP cyclohydrolase, partial [Candidatus Egerieousia sp.]|nr:phosphoribosyl-AMP cyclohydrolase [Candidatus Egerieousia sp.]
MEKNYKNLKIEELDFSKSKDGLIPAVIQDDVTLKVLMLGYMNRESLEKTLQSGKVTFYSRSRATLWTKGETSGNFMEVVDIY